MNFDMRAIRVCLFCDFIIGVLCTVLGFTLDNLIVKAICIGAGIILACVSLYEFIGSVSRHCDIVDAFNYQVKLTLNDNEDDDEEDK